MTDEEKDILYAKWLAGNLSQEEMELLNKSGDIKTLEKIVENVADWDLAAVESSTNQSIQPKKNNRWLAIAASILVLVSSYFTYDILTDEVVYHTGFGETMVVQLPDGSDITLGANSSLSYSTFRWESDKKVNLKGQALFDIGKPGNFAVLFDQGRVNVLGTVFEINSDLKNLLIKCYQGKLEMVLRSKKVTLTEGEGLAYEDGDLLLFEFEEVEPKWLAKYFEYVDVTLGVIFADLSFNTGIDFNIPNSAFLEKKFTGQLPSKNIVSALDILSAAIGVEYTYESEVVTFAQ